MKKIARHIRFLVAVCLFAFALPVGAQCVLEGRVTSEEGAPLEFVKVAVIGEKQSTAETDEKGRYSVSFILEDSVVVRFFLTGYDQREYRFKFAPGERRTLDCALKQRITELNEVNIVEDHSRKTNFTNIDVQKLDDAVGPNAGVENVLKTLPDVASNNEMSSQYSVRGGSYDENLVYINGVEVYRPQLIRSGQQEGMSIINPDMVDHLMFSPGGFEASYGDKMSSVLDIIYSRPQKFHAKLSGSLLGASAFVEGAVKNFTYSIGVRQHSNQYIFKSLDTKGSYTTSYTDLQTVLGYRVNDKIDLSLMAICTRNRYGLVPESQTTTFGSFMESLELDIYFDGQEKDGYVTHLGTFALDYHPSENFTLKWITSVQSNLESEVYDIQDQYWLYELNIGSEIGEVNKFDRGVGTFLEHARNYLSTRIVSTEFRGIHYAKLGNWKWGVKAQYERIADQVHEWKWVDSADYSMPTTYETPGDSLNQPANPILQFYANADNLVNTIRGTAYLQRELNWITRKEGELRLLVGARAQYYYMRVPVDTRTTATNQQFLFSPRISFNYKPPTKADILFRTSAGVYQQSPFYREMRRNDGSLNPIVKAQQSYQVMQTFDWNFHMFKKPFRLTADVFYKYIDNLVPYTIDNLRVRYDAENSAVGYAAGMSLRLNGEFVPGLESWASFSVMKTQEDILDDGRGWISRPTDQRFSFKFFLQDYIPKIKWWRMSLSLIVGSGLPVTFPNQMDRSVEYRLPTYFRVDWGNTVQLSKFAKLKRTKFFQVVDDVLIGVEVFNLFDYHNVVSYLWVADYENTYYPVPNYLTARQFNVKLTITF